MRNMKPIMILFYIIALSVFVGFFAFILLYGVQQYGT